MAQISVTVAHISFATCVDQVLSPRSSRWANELEAAIGRPDWGAIVSTLSDVIDADILRSTLHRDADAVARLPETMSACGVEASIIERLTQRCNDIAADLRALKG